MYLAAHDPAAGGGIPPCPFHAMTGLWCPGCGLTRATHAVLRGHIAAAFGFNLFFPLFLAGTVIAWLAWVRSALGRAPLGWLVRVPARLPVAAGVALLAFGALRNMPGLQALAP